jgi:hypothetical protein
MKDLSNKPKVAPTKKQRIWNCQFGMGIYPHSPLTKKIMDNQRAPIIFSFKS